LQYIQQQPRSGKILQKKKKANLVPSQVGQRHGLMNTGSKSGDHSTVELPLQSLHA
jgi:hypothetical protein